MIGDKEMAAKMAEVMVAYAKGKKIQMLCSGGVWDTLVGTPSWNWNMHEYRVKPEPKVRPWTKEEVPIGKIVVSTVGNRYAIQAACDGGLYLIGTFVDYIRMLETHKMGDGSPCGVVE